MHLQLVTLKHTKTVVLHTIIISAQYIMYIIQTDTHTYIRYVYINNTKSMSVMISVQL